MHKILLFFGVSMLVLISLVANQIHESYEQHSLLLHSKRVLLEEHNKPQPIQAGRRRLVPHYERRALFFRHDIPFSLHESLIPVSKIALRAIDVTDTDNTDLPVLNDQQFEFLNLEMHIAFLHIILATVRSKVADKPEGISYLDFSQFSDTEESYFHTLVQWVRVELSLSWTTAITTHAPCVYTRVLEPDENVIFFGFLEWTAMIRHLDDNVYFLTIMLDDYEDIAVGFGDARHVKLNHNCQPAQGADHWCAQVYDHQNVKWFYKEKMGRQDAVLFKRTTDHHDSTAHIPRFFVNRGERQRMQILIIPLRFRDQSTGIVQAVVLVLFLVVWCLVLVNRAHGYVPF